ncbi:DEAD-box ATP-dependent RNA helicase 7 [Tanacetum coccineum]|uniref:RNA helicase n=2 Tax=Tanacetum TaxID=99105 RepID=A0ABQ4WEL3_9ASTR
MKKSKTEGGSDSEKSEKKSSKKKRKANDDSDSSVLIKPTEAKESMKKSKKKKAKTETAELDEVVAEVIAENPNAVSKFRISEPLKNALKAKGIEALFPIQAQTYDSVYDGLDLIGKAKTGQGKTLAFILPILESLTNGPEKASRKTGYGRAPIILVLLPTRELAKQVYTDFEYYGKSVGLTACCLYGGASIGPQTTQLKRGVDIVVGAVGRIKDHIDRGNLDLKSLKFRILDEANEMLRQSFVEDVEYILSKVNDATKVQTVLFSATLPSWVNHIAAKFLKSDKKIVDLVGLKLQCHELRSIRLVMSSNNASSAVTYTSISFDSDGPSWGIPLMNAGELLEMDPYEEIAQQGQAAPLSPAYMLDPMGLDHHIPVYIPKPVYLEFHMPSDDDIQIEDQYGYCKNLKKTVKTGQSRTRDGKECARAEDLIARKVKERPGLRGAYNNPEGLEASPSGYK